MSETGVPTYFAVFCAIAICTVQLITRFNEWRQGLTTGRPRAGRARLGAQNAAVGGELLEWRITLKARQVVFGPRKARSTRTSKTLRFPSPPKAVLFCSKWSLHCRPGTPTVTSVVGPQRVVLPLAPFGSLATAPL